MSADEASIESAVRQKEASKWQSVLQKLFAVWFDAFVYNQIWEDPRVDLQALKLNETSRVLTISSGGCNALNYLIENPEGVTAVDLNRHHIFLLNLKVAALKFLPDFESFFNFFGLGKHARNVENYWKFIAPNLDAPTRRFWEANGFFGKLLYGNRINYFQNGGLYEHSRNGYFLRFFHAFSKFLGCQPDKLLEAETPAEQEKLYQKYINPFFDSFIVKTIAKMPLTLFGLGVPPQQYDELKKDLAAGKTIIDIYRARAHRLACDYPVSENYFAWQAFARRYDYARRRAVPEYLKEENYARLKANAEKLTTKIGSVTEEIKSNPPNAFNRFVFLDAQDWMNPETLTDLWRAIAERGEENSRIIFRTASAFSPVETNLPEDLRRKFYYEKDWSHELFKQDRASIYGGFHLYILRN